MSRPPFLAVVPLLVAALLPARAGAEDDEPAADAPDAPDAGAAQEPLDEVPAPPEEPGASYVEPFEPVEPAEPVEAQPLARPPEPPARARVRRAARAEPEPTRRGYRRERHRRSAAEASAEGLACVYVEDGHCYYDEVVYVGASELAFGFSIELVGGLYATSLNGLSSPRLEGGDLDAGIVPIAGAAVRGWLLYDRLRLGVVLQLGAAIRARETPLTGRGVFEEGSALGDGRWNGVWGFAAYQPQLSELVQLWFGGRVGVSELWAAVEWSGRSYASLQRVGFSLGPELGVMFSGDALGVAIWAFVDLAQPGAGQLSVGLVYEEPRPPGAAY
ncbi:MAG: hypothetical protein KF729_19440 [Sandaracinaceae bacterium]|nr:hypothetical protein [Sandaracinaceae bacterium]